MYVFQELGDVVSWGGIAILWCSFAWLAFSVPHAVLQRAEQARHLSGGLVDQRCLPLCVNLSLGAQVGDQGVCRSFEAAVLD
jgi:hypothetical protein